MPGGGRQSSDGGQTTTISQSNCRKVFLQRDYGEGCGVRFQTRFPTELEGKIDKHQFDHTVKTLNSLYEEAEKVREGGGRRG